MKKFVVSLIAIFVVGIIGIIGYNVTHETIPAGFVGYVYDRTAGPDDNVFEGTSVINEERTGRISINPITQDVHTYPTTIISENWTRPEEGDHKNDMSMQMATKEGKNIDADIYISVRPTDIGKIIKSFGTKSFDAIIDNDIYGLSKGKLSSVSQDYSVYDVQSNRTEIQQKVFDILSKTLDEIYGVELVRFEIGTLILPADIQEKIDEKTQAQNEVELAKLEREKQNEINQQLVDEQKAKSEKEMLQRQAEADAKAYEITKAAEAKLEAQEAEIKIAELKVEQARLEMEAEVEIARLKADEAKHEREAELEKQKSYTEAYFRDKELDVQLEAVKAINPSISTIVTSGNGEGFEAIIGLKEVLEQVG